MDNDEVEKLREQVRNMNAQIAQLTRENGTLSERLSIDASRVSKAVFTLDAAPTATIDTAINTEPIMMGGVAVQMFGAYKLDNTGQRQFHIWFEFVSPTQHDTVLLASISYKDEINNTAIADELVKSNFLRIGGDCVSRSSFIPATKIKDSKVSVSVNVKVKLIKSAKDESIPFSDRDEMGNIKIKDEVIPVNISYLSAWSGYFGGYFASPMKESKNGIYPVEDCDSSEFREMIDVIYPSCKPISQWNVMSLIKLADRFIMPSLSRKCEVFLTDRSKHNLTDAELLKIADEYRLEFTKAIVLECTSADQLHKNVIAKEEYKSYSEELKKAIDTRYVESKVPERNKC